MNILDKTDSTPSFTKKNSFIKICISPLILKSLYFINPHPLDFTASPVAHQMVYWSSEKLNVFSERILWKASRLAGHNAYLTKKKPAIKVMPFALLFSLTSFLKTFQSPAQIMVIPCRWFAFTFLSPVNLSTSTIFPLTSHELKYWKLFHAAAFVNILEVCKSDY